MVRSSRRQKRNHGALWRRIGVVSLFVPVFVAVGWGIQQLRDPNNMPIRAVQIEGEFRHLSAKQLEEAVSGYVSEGFFNVNVEAVRAAVETLPWVYRASVRRVWPDALRVKVKEQKALARWNNKGLINIYGEFFAPAANSFPTHLPVLSGPMELLDQVVDQYLAMTKVVRSVGRDVKQLAQDQRRAWFMEWDNDVELKLGRSDPYPRLLRFLRVYPDLLAANEPRLRTVDLRYSNGFAVHWDSQGLEEPGQPG
jgi:cell division protein FtsQ